MERSGSFRRILGLRDNSVSGNNDGDGDRVYASESGLRHSESGGDISRKRSMVKPERQRYTPDNPQYYYSLASEESNINVRPSTTGADPRLITSTLAQRNLSSHLEGTAEEPILNDPSYEVPERIPSNAHQTRILGHLNLGRQDSRASQRSQASNLRRIPSGLDRSPSGLGRTPSGRGRLTTNATASRLRREAAVEDGVRIDDHSYEEAQHLNLQPVDPQAADTGPGIPIEEQLGPDTDARDAEYDERHHVPPPHMPRESRFDPWQTYCRVLTFPVAPFMMAWFGMKSPERQMAWREKIGLISVILVCGAAVGFLTFGFTQTVCSSTKLRIRADDVKSDYLVVSGVVYEMGEYQHPGVSGIDDNSPILYPPVDAGGKDASFLFQNVNGNCKNVIKPKSNTSIPHTDDGMMGWYFPCQLMDYGNNTLIDNHDIVAKNFSDFYSGWGCHTYNDARGDLFDRKPTAALYYTWDDLAKDENAHLITFNGDILDLSKLDYLLKDDVDYPDLFDSLRHDDSLRGRDISQEMSYGERRRTMNCLREITKVGEVDSEPIGCIASKVVLYISLVFIMGLVIVKFVVACYFRFFMARYQGAFPVSETEFHNREHAIESWGDNINTSAQHYRGNIPVSSPLDSSGGNEGFQPVPSIATTFGTRSNPFITRSSFFGGGPLTSTINVGAQLKPQYNNGKRRSVFIDRLTNNPNDSQQITGVTMSTQNPQVSSSKVNSGQSLRHQPLYRQSIISATRQSMIGSFRRNTFTDQFSDGLPHSEDEDISYRGMQPEMIMMSDLAPPSIAGPGVDPSASSFSVVSDGVPESGVIPVGPIGSTTDYIVPQPPLAYQPFGYPLAHVMCMVTAYSESVDGLRTTLDSICTTDYPNSHKMVMIVCDGLIKGSGNNMTTPEICLSMMKDFTEPVDETLAYSYVSVVSGEKRHNMAKVYAGFYDYDDSTVAPELQQRVPVICIVKCGTPKEASAAKPGNRGKRDSQVILMSFLQHVMFDERMTELDFEIFNGIRGITGIAPDYYEMMLMVDADTKVFPDCLTHMVAEMVRDPKVMGLCGETKIANKRQSWVCMIQVFEYFISHHQAKGFESVFGAVSCLPGCFSMYRIKSPKGAEGYWVPILCNPDIVERYSDNVIDTLHRKNLLLLGEDRYLSTLMAKTFPKRKTIFVPKAACKTVVPDEFKVLLSQRRRWINSTIHNLFELVLVRKSCGVFVISMQFVVFIDLISTLVLPAAIAFTLYVIITAIVSKPTPTLSLILLAMILGLPGLLIVVTATRISYLVWMGIYILALPIWNFVLPMYAYWKFDDFSWGETRAIAGGDKGHEEADGEFDSSQIVMKRWKDFQSDRAKETAITPYGC